MVDRLDHVVRFGREDGHGVQRSGIGLAALPEAGHGEGHVTLTVEPVGSFRAALGRLPVVESRGEDETGAGFPGVPESRFLGGGLGASVDEPLVVGLGPLRQQTPANAVDPVGGLVRDDLDGFGGRDVVPRPVLLGDGRVEPRAEVGRRREQGGAATHGLR